MWSTAGTSGVPHLQGDYKHNEAFSIRTYCPILVAKPASGVVALLSHGNTEQLECNPCSEQVRQMWWNPPLSCAVLLWASVPVLRHPHRENISYGIGISCVPVCLHCPSCSSCTSPGKSHPLELFCISPLNRCREQ